MRSFIIFSVLVLQASASFFDIFTPVEQSFGKLVTDVVTDIRDTIDCTLLAVENVFSIGGMFGDNSQYQEKCNGQKYQDPQTEVNSASPTYTVEEDPAKNTVKQEITQEIDESVSKASEHIKNILEQSHASEKIENVKNSLKNETDRLVQISELLSRELYRLPETVRRKFEFKEDQPSINSLLEELKLLYTVEQKDKSSAQANEVRRTFDKVLDILHASSSNQPLSDEDEVKEIVKYLGKMTNDSIVDVEKQVEEWSEEQNNKLKDIKSVVLSTNSESQAKISKINDSESKTETKADVTKVLNEKLDEIEKAQEQILGFSGTLKDLAKNILDKVTNSSAPVTDSIDLEALDKLKSNAGTTTESNSELHNSIDNSKENGHINKTETLQKRNNTMKTTELRNQISSPSSEKNETKRMTETNTLSSNSESTNLTTTKLNKEVSKVKETTSQTPGIVGKGVSSSTTDASTRKEAHIDSAGVDHSTTKANLKVADSSPVTIGLMQTPLPYLLNSTPHVTSSPTVSPNDHLTTNTKSSGEINSQSSKQTSSQSSIQSFEQSSSQSKQASAASDTQNNYSEKKFTQSQTSSTSQTSATSMQSLNSSTQMGNTSLQSTPISQTLEKSSESQSTQTDSQTLNSQTSSVSPPVQQDQPPKIDITEPSIPKSFKELAEKLFDEAKTDVSTEDEDIPFDESFLDSSFLQDYFDNMPEDETDQLPPELSSSMMDKLFGSDDPVDKKEAVIGAKNLIQESKLTNKVLNNFFSNVDHASAPNVFDNPHLLDFDQE